MVSSRNAFLAGAVALLLCIVGGYLTYSYSQFLIIYSGVTTFYSLLALIALFVIKEFLDYRKEERDTLQELHKLLVSVERVRQSVDNYEKEIIRDKKIPSYSLGYFDYDLPMTIKKTNTRPLKNIIWNLNDNLEVLDDWREDMLDIVFKSTLDPKKGKNALDGYRQEIHEALGKTIDALKRDLAKIKNILKDGWSVS